MFFMVVIPLLGFGGEQKSNSDERNHRCADEDQNAMSGLQAVTGQLSTVGVFCTVLGPTGIADHSVVAKAVLIHDLPLGEQGRTGNRANVAGDNLEVARG